MEASEDMPPREKTELTEASVGLRLPEELVVKIFSFAAIGDHQQLLSICLVNKRFHRIASELLAQSWTYFDNENGKSAGFLRLLLRRPELQNKIKCLRFENFRTIDSWRRVRRPGSFPISTRSTRRRHKNPRLTPHTTAYNSDRATLTKAADQAFEQLKFENRPDWVEQVELEVPDALLTLMLAWSVNLEELRVNFESSYHGGFRETVIEDFIDLCAKTFKHKDPRNANGKTRVTAPSSGVEPKWLPLSKLRHLHLLDGYLHDIATLFYLPSLNCLKLSGVPGQWSKFHSVHGNDFPIATSSVEEIILYRMQVDMEFLGAMTMACRQLKQLSVDWGYCELDRKDKGDPNDDALVRQLFPSSLKCLTLNNSRLRDFTVLWGGDDTGLWIASTLVHLRGQGEFSDLTHVDFQHLWEVRRPKDPQPTSCCPRRRSLFTTFCEAPSRCPFQITDQAELREEAARLGVQLTFNQNHQIHAPSSAPYRTLML